MNRVVNLQKKYEEIVAAQNETIQKIDTEIAKLRKQLAAIADELSKTENDYASQKTQNDKECEQRIREKQKQCRAQKEKVESELRETFDAAVGRLDQEREEINRRKRNATIGRENTARDISRRIDIILGVVRTQIDEIAEKEIDLQRSKLLNESPYTVRNYERIIEEAKRELKESIRQLNAEKSRLANLVATTSASNMESGSYTSRYHAIHTAFIANKKKNEEKIEATCRQEVEAIKQTYAQRQDNSRIEFENRLRAKEEQQQSLERSLNEKLDDRKELTQKQKGEMKEFLANAKNEFDQIYGVTSYSLDGKNVNFSYEMPHSICIGSLLEKEILPVVKAVYGNSAPKTGMPIQIPLKTRQNIMIRVGSLNHGNNELLDRAICGIAMKFYEQFPLGALKVHFADLNQRACWARFVNGFAETQKATCQVRISNRLESINKNDVTELGRKVSGNIQDVFDLYREDDTQAYNLIVIRSGFNEILRHGGADTVRLLQNFSDQAGRVYGVGLIIVDDFTTEKDYASSERLDEYTNIVNNSLVVCFDGKKFTLNNRDVALCSYTSDSYMSDIEKECKSMSAALDSSKRIISYDEIGFRSRTHTPVGEELSIPVGKCGSRVFSVPFACSGKSSNVGGLVLGRTGHGKTSLFHSLIINGCMKYSPKDLELWLLDFKQAGAATSYLHSKLPHLKKVSKNNVVGDAENLMELLNREIHRRATIKEKTGLKYIGVGFDTIHSYNEFVDAQEKAGNHISVDDCVGAGKHMSRILVLIDEAQKMFLGTDDMAMDDVNKLTKLIGRVVTEGRHVGVHVVMFAQNLSMGRAHYLSEALANHIQGKFVFNLDNKCLRESGFGNLFNEKENEIAILPKGEVYATVSDAAPRRVKIAFAEAEQRLAYCQQICEEYKQKAEFLIVGERVALSPDERPYQSGKTYRELLETVNHFRKDTQVPRAILGEETISRLAVVADINIPIIAVGTDSKIMSSLCTSMLLSILSDPQKKRVYVCNAGSGVGTQMDEKVFNAYIESAIQRYDCVTRFKRSEFKRMLMLLYQKYVERSQKRDNEEDYMGDGMIYVIVNDLTALKMVRNEVEYFDDVTQILGNTYPEDSLHFGSDHFLDYDAYDSKLDDANKGFEATDANPIPNACEGKSVREVICELCKYGSMVGIVLNFTTQNGDLNPVSSMLSETTQKIIFNRFSSGLYLSIPRYSLENMLKHEDSPDGQTMAVFIKGSTAIRFRPILF